MTKGRSAWWVRPPGLQTAGPRDGRGRADRFADVTFYIWAPAYIISGFGDLYLSMPSKPKQRSDPAALDGCRSHECHEAVWPERITPLWTRPMTMRPRKIGVSLSLVNLQLQVACSNIPNPGAAQAQRSRRTRLHVVAFSRHSGLANPPIAARTDRESRTGRRRRQLQKEIENLFLSLSARGRYLSLSLSCIIHNRPAGLAPGALRSTRSEILGSRPSVAFDESTGPHSTTYCPRTRSHFSTKSE